MNVKHLITFALPFALLVSVQAQKSVDLKGSWYFELDRKDQGIKEKWYKRTRLTDDIELPGSMTQRLKGDDVTVSTQWTASLYDSSYYHNPYMEKYRREGNVKLPFFLTPNKHYVGVAWYNRDFSLPQSLKNRRVYLYLERPHITTTVWVNGDSIGYQNSLCVPHVYDITDQVKSGKNQLAIRIDNRVDEVGVGIDSHSITDQTQGNWNGIVGAMEIRLTAQTLIDDVQVYPDLSKKEARVKITLANHSPEVNKGKLTLLCESFNSEIIHKIKPITQRVSLKKGANEVEMVIAMGDEMQTWDEFSPALYRLKVVSEAEKEHDEREVTFGMREFKIVGKMFYINGRQTMLRGTVENCDFPLTGYAPMEVSEWERVFKVCKQFGLNHVRYHSYCPPEAAFIAADKVGIYMQPEGPSWPNHGVRLGNGQVIDTYLMEETKRLTKAYGNYASYCMLASGNEPAGGWVKWVTNFVDYWEKTDSRRVYTGASVGGSWAWQPRNMFHVKAGARGLGEWVREAPASMDDFRGRIDTVSAPYVSHETGQWCAFPDFDEIKEYTGVKRAKNFEIFQDILTENGMATMGRKFLMAAGKLQALCYKYEIERTLRTPNYAGFQLLALNDYSGQGTALVGLLNVFFKEKGYINAEEFRQFCAPTVLLARIPKFTYYNDEVFEATLELAHWGEGPIQESELTYTVTDEKGNVLDEQTQKIRQTLQIGNNIALGEIAYGRRYLERIRSAQKLTLTATLTGYTYLKGVKREISTTNHWDAWVYPRQSEFETGDIHITDTLDKAALTVLDNGGKVLICAAEKISYGKDIVQRFLPVFWNTSWFKMRPPHTTGLYIQHGHPVFKDFPTDYHSDLQWWELVNRQQVMQFSQFPADFQPLVQSIDTWFLSRKIGMLFEANVGKGKLMMTTMPIKGDLNNKQGAYMYRPVAMQMMKSILGYMNSEEFEPELTIAPEFIEGLFSEETARINMFTKDAPDEIKNPSAIQ